MAEDAGFLSSLVFPARAGMSPSTERYTGLSGGVPRASGDEPAF